MSNYRIEFRTRATSYGSGPFHPAFYTSDGIMYWPNITKATEEEAYAWAQAALNDAQDAAEAVAKEWNVWRAL